LRPLPYGQKLSRRDKATKMSMEAPVGRGRNEEATQKFELETLSEWSNAFDFDYCIGEHNLQAPDGELLNFHNPMTLKLLDPRVGSEIERLINSLNEDEEEEALEDFLKRSTSPSQDGVEQLPTPT
jgi:hypothetical protein